MFHLKNPISYLHCTELLPVANQDTAVMLMQFFDTGSIVISMIYFLVVDNYTSHFLVYMHILGIIASLLFMIFVPESPRHLFMGDSKSPQGINILNYMAWMNGSKFRVPKDAEMDSILQVIKDKKRFDETSNSQTTMKKQLSDSIQEQIKAFESNGDSLFTRVVDDLKTLFCSDRVTKNQLCLLVLWIAMN